VFKTSQILSINAPSRKRRVLAWIGSSLLLALSASPLHAATFNVPDGDLAALQLAILNANSNGESDTINLASNGVYQFTQVTPNPLPIGQTTALPAITTGMVINGNNSRFVRPQGFPDNFRFLFKSGPAPLEVNDLTFANGREVSGSDTFSGGGAVYLGGTAIFRNCTFINNSSSANGGAILVRTGTITLENSTFLNNSTTLRGGAVQLDTPAVTATIRNSSFVSNSAGDRAGALISRGETLIENTEFSRNSATDAGALSAIGELTVRGSEFRNNSVTGLAGAALLFSGSIENSLFEGNQAREGGGALRVQGDVSLLQSTVSGNTSVRSGAAIELASGSTTLDQCTVTNNTGVIGTTTGVLVGGSVALTLRNSIIAGNDVSYQIQGPIDVDLNNILSGDPRLGPLAGNGGALETHALLPSSPAIDAGDDAFAPAAQDMREEARISGSSVDVGAVEFQQPLQVTTSGSAQATTLETGFANPLQITLIDGISEPVVGETIAFDYPSSGPTAVPQGPVSLTTDASGQVSTLVAANDRPGSYQVASSLAGGPLELSATFDLENIGSDLSGDLTSAAVPAVPGEPLDYTLNVTNPGPADISAALVTNEFPSECDTVTWTCAATGSASCTASGSGTIVDVVVLPAQSEVSYAITCLINPGATGTLVSQGALTSPGDTNDGNNSYIEGRSLLPSADLEILNSGPAAAAPGDSVTYTLDVSNSGPSDAQNVSVDDPTPAGLTFESASVPCSSGFPCDLGNLASSGSTSIDVTFLIPSDANGSVTNTVSIASDTADPNADNNSATIDTALQAEADLTVQKTGPETATAGESASYTLVVTNTGPSDAQNVLLEESAPAGLSLDAATAPCTGGFPCSLGKLNAGDSISVEATFAIDPQAQGVIENVASVSSDTPDPAIGNDASSVSTTVDSVANLSLEKTTETDVAAEGQLVTYSILVQNEGPSQAADVIVTDNLPAGQSLVSTSGCAEDPAGAPTCTIGSLDSGASASVDIRVRISEVAESTTSTNIATVSSGTSDPVSTDNSSAAGVQLIRTLSVPMLNWITLSLLIMVTLFVGLMAGRIRA
jgi:uncharacterized repeat protein (TIGR01451 family)